MLRDSLSTTLLVELLRLSPLPLKPVNPLPPEAKLLKVPVSLVELTVVGGLLGMWLRLRLLGLGGSGWRPLSCLGALRR